MNGHTTTCEFLLNKGSNVNATNRNGDTPLRRGEYLLNN